MKNQHFIFIFFVGLILFLPLGAVAQVKSGFKHYRNNNYSKASVKFRKALDIPDQFPLARLAMFRMQEQRLIWSKYSDIQAAYLLVDSLSYAFEALPEARKAYYSNQKWIRFRNSDFNLVKNRLLELAFWMIEQNNSVLQLDSCMTFMRPHSKQAVAKQAYLEDKVVMKNLYNEDYRVLRSVAKNHAQVLRNNKIDPLSIPLNDRLLKAFLKAYPLYTFRNFIVDFPQHWTAVTCSADTFPLILESRDVAKLATFLDNNKLSNLDYVLVNALMFPQNSYLANLQDITEERQRLVMSELHETTRILWFGFKDSISADSVVQQVKKGLAVAAPSLRSYLLLLKGLSKLKTMGAWTESQELIQFAKPLFPDEEDVEKSDCLQLFNIYNKQQAWFIKVAELLAEKASGIRTDSLNAINSVFGDEYAPLIAADGQKLWLLRHQMEDTTLITKMLFSIRNDSLWSKPIEEKGSGAVVRYGTNWEEDRWILGNNGRLVLSGYPRNTVMPAQMQEFAWIGKGSLSPDGLAMVFEASLDAKPIENDADIDLYVCTFDPASSSWTEPQRLPVNTFQQEYAPFLHADNKTLVFGSKGHFGFAGADLYQTKRLDDTWLNWSTPKNLGKEINGYEDEGGLPFSLPASGKNLFYSMKADNRESQGEVYQVKVPEYSRVPRVIILNGVLPRFTGSSRICAGLDFPLPDRHSGQRVLDKGQFRLFVEDKGQESVFVYVEDSTLYSTNLEVDLRGIPDVSTLQRVPFTIPFQELISKELPVPMEHVHFSPGSTELSPRAQRDLDWMVYQFRKRKHTLLIAGHGDELDGSDSSALSLARAEAVKQYLVSKGMPYDRLWTQGFGKRKSLETTNALPVKPFSSRRVEIMVKVP
jgi:hypothetical protein